MNKIEFGDCRETMRRWVAEGVKAQMCVTSPPYFGLRDYGHEGQIGLEQTPEAYITAMVEVFRCVKDVLADDGTLWVNIADSWGSGKNYPGVKQKDLIGIPWLFALALRNDGWYLRQDIIWHKPNPMNESVNDRCTKAHEYIFLLSKTEKYFYDRESIREPVKSTTTGKAGVRRSGDSKTRSREHWGIPHNPINVTVEYEEIKGANKRSVWTVSTRPYKGAHFATFPTALIEPCILAGSRIGDVVLDPFMGSGTTAAVAVQHGRKYLGCELNPEYGQLQQERIQSVSADVSSQLNLLLEA
jgi:DNA modification methylase